MPTNAGKQLNLTYPPELIAAARTALAAKGTTITAEVRKLLERAAGMKAPARGRGRPRKESEKNS